MKSIMQLTTFVSAAMAADVAFPYNYKTNKGADWKDIPDVYEKDNDGNPTTAVKTKNQCNQERGGNTFFNQSPIDLRFDWPAKNAGFDNFQK